MKGFSDSPCSSRIAVGDRDAATLRVVLDEHGQSESRSAKRSMARFRFWWRAEEQGVKEMIRSLTKNLGAGVALLVALVMASASSALAMEPERPDQERFLIRAEFADGRLWLLSDAGVLSTIIEGVETSPRVQLTEPVYDLCVDRGDPVAVTGDGKNPTHWTLRRFSNGAWSVLAVVRTKDDRLFGLDCEADAITLLTTGRIIAVKDGKTTDTPLTILQSRGSVSAVLGTSAAIYVGFNAGEWGGGLRRIDRRTGVMTGVEGSSDDACGRLLSSVCDPVHGVALEPWRPGCIAVATGLMHMFSQGAVVEVCDGQIRKLYSKPAGHDMFGRPDQGADTVAFFGLLSDGDALWAVADDGLYRIGANGTAQVSPLPEFKKVGNFYVSFELPHLVLVLTEVNERQSVGGAAPMLVVR
jgi:hypothetical protein